MYVVSDVCISFGGNNALYGEWLHSNLNMEMPNQMKSSGSKKKTLGDLCFVLEILVTRRKWEVEMCVEKENLVLGVCMGKKCGIC